MNFRRFAVLSSVMLFAFYALLFLSLFQYFDAGLFVEHLLSERVRHALKLSVITASISSGIAVLLGLPAAYAISRYRFAGKNIIDTMLELPMIVSPAALGAMILIFFSSPVGQKIQQSGFDVVFTWKGIVVAQFTTVAGMATRLLKAVMDEVPTRYEMVARSLGAKPAVAFFTVTLPLMKRGIIASLILTWAKALGEFGATFTVAGAMAMKTETLSTAIFMRLSTANIEAAVTLILIVVGVGFTTLYVTRLITAGREKDA